MPNFSLKMNVVNTVNSKKIQKYANQAGAVILVGFPDGRMHIDTIHTTDKDGKRKTTTAVGKQTSDLARELSFGTAEIPARPFLQDGVETQRNKILEEIKTQARVQKETGSANWDKVGTMAVGAINEFVRSDYYKSTIPNSPEWIEEKGSDTPLIDGGDLIGDLHYIVKEGK